MQMRWQMGSEGSFNPPLHYGMCMGPRPSSQPAQLIGGESYASVCVCSEDDCEVCMHTLFMRTHRPDGLPGTYACTWCNTQTTRRGEGREKAPRLCWSVEWVVTQSGWLVAASRQTCSACHIHPSIVTPSFVFVSQSPWTVAYFT